MYSSAAGGFRDSLWWMLLVHAGNRVGRFCGAHVLCRLSAYRAVQVSSVFLFLQEEFCSGRGVEGVSF